MTTTFVAHLDPSTADALKTPLLYFDQVEIRDRDFIRAEALPKAPDQLQPVFVISSVHRLVADEFKERVSPALEAGVLAIRPPPPAFLDTAATGEIQKLLANNFDLLIKDTVPPSTNVDGSETRSVQFSESRDIFSIHNRFAGPIEAGKPFSFGLVSAYYEGLLADAMRTLAEGNDLITNSQALGRLINFASSDEVIDHGRIEETLRQTVAPMMACHLLDCSLVNIAQLEFEQILELRYQMRNELGEFRQAIAVLSCELVERYSPSQLLREGRDIAQRAVDAPLRDIENKMEDWKYSILRSLLDAWKQPANYFPFAGTAFFGVPIEVAALLSLGLSAGNIALDAYHSRQVVKRSPFYFAYGFRQRCKPPELDARGNFKSPWRTTPEVPTSRTVFTWPSAARKV